MDIIKGKTWTFGENIDTDVIIPGRYLRTFNPQDLADHVLEGERPDFTKNVKKGDIIVADENFGCGSSREHAAWAIHDAGYQAVVSSSFADIFKGNALNNSLVPVKVSPEYLAALTEVLKNDPSLKVVIDLGAQTISVDGVGVETFPIVGYKKECLMNGYSDIDYLLSDVESILNYEKTSLA